MTQATAFKTFQELRAALLKQREIVLFDVRD